MSAFDVAGSPGWCRCYLLAALALPPLVLAGCASNPRSLQSPVINWSLAANDQPAPVAVQKVELEDDGVPVQSAPSWRVRNAPDDPTQPWSPNYGRTEVKPAPMAKSKSEPPAYQVADGSPE